MEMEMKCLNVWVVEDDHFYQNMLISYLALIGFKAKGFYSGEECLDYINEKPDVVLLDHNLGDGLKGVDVLRKIKSESRNTHVIYISGEETVSVVSDVYQNGSDDFITKDNASLIRLKMRLEKIEQIKAFNQKKNRKKRSIAITAAGVVLLLFIGVITYFTLMNS
jgi:DNA-binding response OmpR family regulator